MRVVDTATSSMSLVDKRTAGKKNFRLHRKSLTGRRYLFIHTALSRKRKSNRFLFLYPPFCFLFLYLPLPPVTDFNSQEPYLTACDRNDIFYENRRVLTAITFTSELLFRCNISFCVAINM